MKKILALTVFIGSTIGMISSANALVSTRQASVTIVEPLSLTVVSDLAFGKVQRPTSGIATVIMTSAGAVSGTATHLGGTTSGGSYTVVGDATETVGITVADAGGATGVSLASFTPSYGGTPFTNGATGLAAPGTGTALVFGATLNIDSATVTPGIKTPSYNITVVYQ